MPRSPAIVSMGSPGIRRISTNTSNVIPMKVGTTRLSRVKTIRNISCHLRRKGKGKGRSSESHSALCLPLILHVDAIEDVASERRQLEVNDTLADGLQLHRMRDGEPRRLLLEDHLGLFVKLGPLGLIADRLCLHDYIVERLVA